MYFDHAPALTKPQNRLPSNSDFIDRYTTSTISEDYQKRFLKKLEKDVLLVGLKILL